MTFRGKQFKVNFEYYLDKETGLSYTTDETDTKWLNSIRTQYFNTLSIPIINSSVVTIFFDPTENYWKAFNKSPEEIDRRFYKHEERDGEFILEAIGTYGFGVTPEEALKDLYDENRKIS